MTYAVYKCVYDDVIHIVDNACIKKPPNVKCTVKFSSWWLCHKSMTGGANILRWKC